MQNIKFMSVSAGIGFVLSLFCGLFSHSSFGRVFLIAILFALIFAILSILIQLLFNKFLNVDAVGDDVGYSISASISGGNKGSVNHKVDITINEADLPQTGNNNHYEVGDNRQMLNDDDIKKSTAESSKIGNEIFGGAGNLSGNIKVNSSLSKSMNEGRTLNNAGSTQDTAPKQDFSSAAASANAKRAAKTSSGFNSDSLPDIGDISFIQDDNPVNEEDPDIVLNENSDFISSALKYKDDNSNSIKDAALMAKAISSIISEEN